MIILFLGEFVLTLKEDVGTPNEMKTSLIKVYSAHELQRLRELQKMIKSEHLQPSQPIYL